MNIFKQFYAFLRLKRAVDLAEKSAKKHHHRFYVLPGVNGVLIVSDRKNFRGLRQKHWIRGASKYTMSDVADKAFYYTAHGNGTGFMRSSEREEKVKEFYRWFESSRREYRAAQKAKKEKLKAIKRNKREQRRQAKKK